MRKANSLESSITVRTRYKCSRTVQVNKLATKLGEWIDNWHKLKTDMSDKKLSITKLHLKVNNCNELLLIVVSANINTKVFD